MTRLFLRGDVRALRERLSIAAVLESEGRLPDDRGRYWCPFHDDERPGGSPSADVYNSGGGDLFGCWSCNRKADAIELLMTLRGCDVDEAVRVGEQLAGDAPPPPRKKRTAVPPERLERDLRVSTTGVRFPRDVDPLEAFAAAEKLPPVPYLRELGWAGDYRGRVVIPHRSLSGELTGLRWRVPPSWEKSSRPGSEFRQVYGGWRAGFPDEIWICEGETDTAWAGYHLEPLGVSAVGLPSATYRAGSGERELFRRRHVVLAFDPDAAGTSARLRWSSDLSGVARRITQLRLDDGRDLRSSVQSPVELREMIRAAR